MIFRNGKWRYHTDVMVSKNGTMVRYPVVVASSEAQCNITLI